MNLRKLIPTKNACYAVSAEVLELDEFDEGVFKTGISEIQVPTFNKLVFVFRDGRSVEKIWQDRSRSESWTEEMRQAARERGSRPWQ